MLKINFQILINLDRIKILSIRHVSTLQIRVTVHQLQKNKKSFKTLTPYLIINPQNKEKKKQITSSIGSNNSNNKIQRTATNNNNSSQIDNQTNSFLTKTFTVRSLETYNDLKQIVVFKGDFQVTIDEFLNQQSGLTSKNQINKIYVCCELLQVNNFSSQTIDSWIGFSMIDQGNIYLPINFYQINLTLDSQLVFLWSSIEILNEQATKRIQTKKFLKIYNKISTILKNQSQKVFMKPNKFSIQIFRESKIQNPFSQIVKYFNQKTYELWKHFQQNLQNKQKDMIQMKKNNFIKNLNQFHWKNNIQISDKSYNQTNKYQQILLKIKNKQKLNENLIFYPFDEHTRQLKISYSDFQKIAPISSLSNEKNNEKNNKIQFMIFVHGYQASSFDMQTLALYFKSKNPSKIITFVSSSNEGRTQQNIQQLGHRLAIQIKNYINNKLQFQLDQFQISFVCHSMGGLIVRAALRYMQLYKNNFKTFLSLSSPHLGYLYHHSTIIKTSLWILNQVKKDPSMIELTMQDNSQLQKTYLYDLSKRKQLQWFKYPIFVGSRQDQYVPFWSALVQDKDFFFQTNDAKIYKSLYKNLSQKIQERIIRIQIAYRDKIRDLSTFLGRTAHIRILNCIQVMEMLYLLLQTAF